MKLKFFATLILCLTFWSCDTLMQMASFVNCNYSFSNISNPTVGGVSLNGINNVNNLNAASLLKLTSGILTGHLPLSTTVNVKASNPNATAAKLAGLDWALDLNSANMFNGSVEHGIDIPAKGSSIIPFVVQIDVMQMLKGENKDNVFSFVNGLLNTGSDNSNVSFRIKPTVMIGGQKLSTGFIKLT